MYFSKYLNSKYMEFVGYDTCAKLIWISGEGNRNTNAIIKQGIPKINMNMTYPSLTLGFGVPHTRTLVISCKNIWSHIYCNHIHQKMMRLN